MTRHHQWIRCVSLVLLVFVGLQLGCKKKTDAERAVLERAKIQEKLKASWELVPYRWLKVAIRSQADPERMRPVQEAVAALKESERLHAVDEKGVKELALLTAAYVKVAIALVRLTYSTSSAFGH